jgi:hypothetical protein
MNHPYASLSNILSSSMQVHDHPNRPEVPLPKYGEMLKSDKMIKGSKIYTDAAWKTRKVPGMENEMLQASVYIAKYRSRTKTQQFLSRPPLLPCLQYYKLKLQLFYLQQKLPLTLT